MYSSSLSYLPLLLQPGAMPSPLRIFSQPEDNSCLFRAIGFILDANPNDPAYYRSMVATVIQSPEPSPLLQNLLPAIASSGHSPQTYASTIQRETSWGGAIELAIFSSVYQVELVAIDVANMKPYTFGEDSAYEKRGYLLYSGIHYDAFGRDNGDAVQTIFNRLDSQVMAGVIDITQQFHNARQYTDTQKFTLRCEDCGQGVVGNQGAQKHALAKGHLNFSEYR
jgi:ubiquitin thioesterase OTU1